MAGQNVIHRGAYPDDRGVNVSDVDLMEEWGCYQDRKTEHTEAEARAYAIESIRDLRAALGLPEWDKETIERVIDMNETPPDRWF